MAYIPYRVNGKRDAKRRYVDTDTGELVSRYRQLVSKYGGATPEQHAKIRSGEYDSEGNPTDRYLKALRQFTKHSGYSDMREAESSREWGRISDNLFAHYPGSTGNAKSKSIWERRQQAIQELWYDYDEPLDFDDYSDFISPSQGE